jgi:hypothetical protein
MRDGGGLALVEQEGLRKQLADYYQLAGTGVTASILRHDPAVPGTDTRAHALARAAVHLELMLPGGQRKQRGESGADRLSGADRRG